MPDDTEQPKPSIEEPLTAATTEETALNAPHVPGAGPVILHGARSLTVEFTDGHTIQISF